MASRQLYCITFALILSINVCSGWNLYKSNHPTRKTTELFERLSHHQIVSLTHNQFHKIDGEAEPLYPMNGRLQFDAFGHRYSLLIRKNVELFSDSFKTELHRFNESTQTMDKHIISTEIPQCYYTAEVESDATSTKGGVFSACKGQGVRGWITAFGETIVIRPKRLLTDVTFKGKHKISDQHIVYKYHHLNRSDYPHHHGPTCGHNHPDTPSYLQKELEKYRDTDPTKIEWIIQQENAIAFQQENVDRTSVPIASRRRLAADTTRYVELAVVNDPGMMAEYGNDHIRLQEKTISTVATLQNYYLNANWGSVVGTIQIVLSAIIYKQDFGDLVSPALSCPNGGSAASLYTNNPPNSGYCEVEYANYLSNFQSYRATSSELREYDNGYLFSFYDFASSVIGYASVPGMCIQASSGGIAQCTYDDEYNGNIVAHEMGHNFYQQHDGSGNHCDAESFIMASVGSPYGARPDSFSSCSVEYTRTFFESQSYSNTLKCLDNKPIETVYAVCRNGFVESGESCDCGQSNCAALDPCCDGSTCALYASSECSNNDICCEDCTVKGSGTVCRALDSSNPCDIEEENCDGSSPECPPDLKYIEGTICDSGDSYGYCYAGQCKSIESQCEVHGAKTQQSYTVGPTSCSNYPVPWQVNEYRCGSNIYCLNTANDNCAQVSSEQPDDGIPCNQSATLPSQCLSGSCEYSADIFTFVWTINQWDSCNSSCKNVISDPSGYQTRSVSCTFQDGAMQSDESKCDPNGNNPKPQSGRTCNNYICDFCKIQPATGHTVCGIHGTCESELKTCDCDSGFAGDRCDEPPGLNFTGIVSQAFKNVSSGRTIALRANPCYLSDPNNSVSANFDVTSNTETVPVDGVTSLSTLYVGATVGVRWRSAGDIELLAVGLIEVDAEGEPVDNAWPFYVGSSLANDDNTCDDLNSTNYDGCLQKLECNDFGFAIPVSTTPGTYKVSIRFNNEFSITSPTVTVICNENNCNSVGHGTCNADNSGCSCEHGWSGYSCEYSLCNVWSFAMCARDDEGNCGSLGATDIKPKCFSSSCNPVASNETVSDSNQCGYNCSDVHFEGDYCEIPTDHCATLTVNKCAEAALCEWDSVAAMCLYKECSQFGTEELCTINSTYYSSNDSWAMFCEWIDDGSNTYCNRVTCGDGTLPECSNGAVRRALFDQYTDEPVSICHAWFCDCTYVDESDSSHWKVSTGSTLIQSIDSSYNYNDPPNGDALTASYIDADGLDLFTCNECSLDCQNGATVDSACTHCADGCPEEVSPFRTGRECDQVFWVGEFRLNVAWNLARIEKPAEFDGLIIQDLAYFLDTDTAHISIWQVKPDSDGSIVYFRYLFDTDDEDSAQIVGGDVMALATKEIKDSTSTASRGFMMQYTDPSVAYSFCIPTKEECDPSKQIDITLIFYICAAGSFGFIVLSVILYRCITRGKRQRAYEEKVREVRQAQLRLMEHHSKARRVGMRDVSKNRAHKIHKAHKKKDKAQKKEIHARAKEEKKLNKIKEKEVGSYEVDGKLAASAHGQQDSQLELEQYRRYSKQQYASSARGQEAYKPNKAAYAASAYGQEAYKPPLQIQRPQQAQSVHSRSHGNSAAADNLPHGWKIYYNNDGVPYYFNATSGETTWRHPSKPPK